MDPIDRAIERCTVIDTTPDYERDAPVREVDPEKFREVLYAVYETGWNDGWAHQDERPDEALAELYPETPRPPGFTCTHCKKRGHLGIDCPETEEGPRETTFECRTCDRCIQGKTDGTMSDPAWRRIARIDGPNAICPACQADPDALQGLIDDGYREAHVETEEGRDDG